MNLDLIEVHTHVCMYIYIYDSICTCIVGLFSLGNSEDINTHLEASQSQALIVNARVPLLRPPLQFGKEMAAWQVRCLKYRIS